VYSLEIVVCVWRCTVLVLHARKDEEEIFNWVDIGAQ